MSSASATIPVGYKQTEVGVIPEDWKIAQFESFCKTFTKQTGFDYTSTIKPSLIQNKIDGYIPFIQNKDFVSLNTNYATDYFAPIDIASRFPMILLDRKCILISISGSIGKVGIFSNETTALIGGAVAVGKFKNLGSLEWVMYYLQSPQGQKQIFSNLKAGAHSNLILDDIRKFKIPIPEQKEQNAVSKAMKNIDSKIDAINFLLTKKRDIKQGAMQEMLTGKTRLPGFSDEWEIKSIGEIAQVIGGGTPSTQVSNYWDGEINWFTPTEVGTTKYISESVRRLTDIGLQKSSASLLPVGTILLTSRAGIGDLGILDAVACTNQGFQSLVCNDKVNNEFLYYVMLTKRPELERRASGSTFLEINPREVKSLLIALPRINEQEAIAEVLSDMDAEISALEQHLEKTKEIKQGMMQQLLTGRIRLVDPSTPVEASE